MTRFPRIIAISLAALLFGLGSVSASANYEGCKHGKYDAAKIASWYQKRQNELHAKLKLSSQQEDAWNTYVAAIKPPVPTRPDWKALSKLTTIERLERIQDLMKQREEHMGQVIAATKTFYAVLTPAQQKIFDSQLAWHGKEKKPAPSSR